MLSTAENQMKQQQCVNKQATILCVDDEPQILSSLQRLFRCQHYHVLTAKSGAEALSILEQKKDIDVIISDMRMPAMTGAELFSEAVERWPSIVRILLTGYADLDSSVAAINEGKIYRYLSKPWDEEALMFSVQSAVEKKQLRDEKKQLEVLTKQQNKELRLLNASLEDKVKLRTADLRRAANMLKKSFAKLKESYKESILVFANMIELRCGQPATNSQVIADFAKAIGKQIELDKTELEDIFFAGILNNVGKIGLNDDICHIPYNELTAKQIKQYHQYPKIGQAILLSLPRLSEAGNIIRSHKEWFNGGGFPEGLSADDISISAQILAIASDFYAMQSGEMTNNIATRDEAYNFIISGSGRRYNPRVVEAFKNVYHNYHGQVRLVKEISIGLRDIKAGMLLTRDVKFRQGMLLLRKGQRLTDELITKISNVYDEMDDRTIYVRPVQNGM